MTENDARRLARIGEFYIQEAILGMLDNVADGLKLGPVADALALPDTGYNATVTGQLHRLQTQGKIHQPGGERMEWALTEAERKCRQSGLNTDNTK